MPPVPMRDDPLSPKTLAQPLVCVLCRRGEEGLLRETLKSLQVAHTQAQGLVAAEEGADALGSGSNVSTTIVLSSNARSLIGKAFPELRHTNQDIIFLRAGVRVSRNWDILLAGVASLHPRIAAVSPVCLQDPYFSIASPNTPPPDLQETNHWLQAARRRKVFAVPFFLPSCVYFKTAALGAVHEALEQLSEDGLAHALWAAGWSLVGFEGLYVDDSRVPRNPRDPRPKGREDITDFLQHHPLTNLRWAFAHRPSTPPTPVHEQSLGPTQLHVAHSWGGGLGQWIHDFVTTDTERRNLVLRSIGTWGRFGQRLALYHGSSHIPLREWSLSLPIRATAIFHYEYQEILNEILQTYGVEVILVSSLIGHSLDVLRTSVHTILVFHDYYPICPFLYLHYNEPCTQCNPNTMESCFVHNRLPRIFRNVTVQECFLLREAYVRTLMSRRIPTVAPSPSVFHQLWRIEPRLQELEHRAIPHGLPSFFFGIPRGSADLETRHARFEGLHVLIPGRVSREKGGLLLRKVFQELPSFTFTLLGCGEDGAAFKKLSNVRMIPHYEREQLPKLVEEIGPHIALLASVVPETFSYTLSEMQALGIPTVASAVGSFVDRIHDGVTGWLCAPTTTAIVDRLRTLAASPQSMHAVAQNLEKQALRTTLDMIRDYHALAPRPFSCPSRLVAYFETANAHGLINAQEPKRHRTLYVNPQAPLRQVVLEFLDYVTLKACHTPRLTGLYRKALTAFLASLRRWLSRV